MSVLTQNGEGEYLLVAKIRILAIIVLKSHKNERKIKEKGDAWHLLFLLSFQINNTVL